MLGRAGSWVGNAGGGAAAILPSSGTNGWVLDDFLNSQFSASTGPIGFFWSINGTATFTKLDPSTSNLNRVGIIQFATGTTLTANATASTNLTSVQLGGSTFQFASSCNMESVPNGTENFLVRMGLVNTFPGAQNGVYFIADRTVSTTNWQAVCVQGSTATVADTGIALATGWINFRFQVNGATNVQFYINGVLVATISTNLPLTNGQPVGPLISIQKVGGTASQLIDFDYVAINYGLTSARGTF